MTIDQLPTSLDYAATMSTPVIIFVVSLIAAVIFLAMTFSQPEGFMTPFFGIFVALIVAAFSIPSASDGLAQLRAEALSQYLDETYGVDVGFSENGVQPHTLDGRAVRDGDVVYKVAVATDGTIILIDDGGKEVPRIAQ